jgi:uncharacterized protein YjbI with pentapeptide repeats
MISHRRKFLTAIGATAASIGSVLCPSLSRSRIAKVSQDELSSAVEQHAI